MWIELSIIMVIAIVELGVAWLLLSLSASTASAFKQEIIFYETGGYTGEDFHNLKLDNESLVSSIQERLEYEQRVLNLFYGMRTRLIEQGITDTEGFTLPNQPPNRYLPNLTYERPAFRDILSGREKADVILKKYRDLICFYYKIKNDENLCIMPDLAHTSSRDFILDLHHIIQTDFWVLDIFHINNIPFYCISLKQKHQNEFVR